MENYNLKVRDIVDKWVEQGANYGLDSFAALKSCISLFYDLYNSCSMEKIVVANYLLTIGYLDAYKLSSYKAKENMQTDGDEDFYFKLYTIDNYNDLVTEIFNNPNFLAKLLHSTYEFNNLNILSKNIIMKSLSAEENDWLLERYQPHELDMSHYIIPVNINMLINYFKEKITYQGQIMNLDFPEAIVCNLVGFIQNLKKVDEENVLDLIIALAKNDYLASKYLITKKLSTDECLLYHLDFYENCSQEEIIYTLLSDQDFLKDAIWMLAATYIYQEYEGKFINFKSLSKVDSEAINKKLSLK